MQKEYKNKKIKSEETKSEVGKIYVFPKYNKKIRATSLEEATKKLNKEMGGNDDE